MKIDESQLQSLKFKKEIFERIAKILCKIVKEKIVIALLKFNLFNSKKDFADYLDGTNVSMFRQRCI